MYVLLSCYLVAHGVIFSLNALINRVMQTVYLPKLSTVVSAMKVLVLAGKAVVPPNKTTSAIPGLKVNAAAQ